MDHIRFEMTTFICLYSLECFNSICMICIISFSHCALSLCLPLSFAFSPCEIVLTVDFITVGNMIDLWINNKILSWTVLHEFQNVLSPVFSNCLWSGAVYIDDTFQHYIYFLLWILLSVIPVHCFSCIIVLK